METSISSFDRSKNAMLSNCPSTMVDMYMVDIVDIGMVHIRYLHYLLGLVTRL